MSIQAAGPGTSGPALAEEPGAASTRMLEVIAQLAADEFTGRRVGTPGGRAAAKWLATHLASLGAQVRLDEFTISGAVKELSATPVLHWRNEPGDWNLVHRRDFAEHLATALQTSVHTGHVAIAGSGNVAGAWVLAASFSATQIAQLAAAGAIGVLLPRSTDDAGWMPKMIAGPAAASLPVLSVRTDLHQQMTASVGHGRPEVTASVPLHTVDVNGVNVYGIFRVPAAGALSVLLTAHFDGVGDDPGAVRFPAAADNASGVAVILEAAQRLHRKLPAGAGLAVALLDGEEAGAHGSAHHAPQVPAGTLVINMDGAAQLHEAAAVEAGGPAHALLTALDHAARQTGTPLRGQAMPSDNRRYVAAGLAAMGIGMGMPGYQTPAETIDRVEPATLLAAADLITATVLHLVHLGSLGYSRLRSSLI